jgi:hypothetical protein
MEEEIKKDRNSEALTAGLIWGLVTVIMTVLIYIIDITLLGDWKFGIGMLVVGIGYASYMGRNFRDEETDGFISFKHSFFYSFVLFFISSVISASFMILLYEVIDPDVKKILADQGIENTEKMMRSFGAPEEAIEKAMEEAEYKMVEQFSAMGIIKSSYVYIISSAIMGLIAGLFIKKKKPDFE